MMKKIDLPSGQSDAKRQENPEVIFTQGMNYAEVERPVKFDNLFSVYVSNGRDIPMKPMDVYTMCETFLGREIRKKIKETDADITKAFESGELYDSTFLVGFDPKLIAYKPEQKLELQSEKERATGYQMQQLVAKIESIEKILIAREEALAGHPENLIEIVSQTMAGYSKNPPDDYGKIIDIQDWDDRQGFSWEDLYERLCLPPYQNKGDGQGNDYDLYIFDDSFGRFLCGLPSALQQKIKYPIKERSKTIYKRIREKQNEDRKPRRF